MIEALKNLSKEELAERFFQSQNTNQKLIEKVSYLEHQISLLQKALFGKKSEQHQAILLPEQTKLEFNEKIDLDLPQDIEQQQISYNRRKPKKIREDFSKLELPADLERVVTVIEPEGKTDDMVKLSEEVTELLAITPQKFFVKKIVRPKYALPNKEGVMIAELPSRPIQGGMVDVSLLVEQVRKSHYIQADETTIKVLDKLKKHTTHLGYYWVYHDVGSGLVLYEYDPSRGQIAPGRFLNGFSGYLQTDGYIVYDILPNKNLKLAGCMAHARRKFYEALENDKPRATWMLDTIQSLYEVEARARAENLSHDQRLELRGKESAPVMDGIKKWLQENCIQALPKSPIGKAIAYMLARWEKLTLFTQEGMLEIDNNLVENAIRPVALGRKNYLFAGSHEAAKRAGIIYSFITCCKKNGYDPYKWLEQTLTKLPDTKKSDLYKLLPVKKQDGV